MSDDKKNLVAFPGKKKTEPQKSAEGEDLYSVQCPGCTSIFFNLISDRRLCCANCQGIINANWEITAS